VSDGIGRKDIARSPDRNAAEAAKRVVGASIVGGRFVYVRGLGERYTNALLNGTPLPSPEPDRQAVPLDLFPSLILDSLTITKQFSPDMPGDFAGGSVRIFTRDFPRETLFQVSLGAGYVSGTTFTDHLSSRGSGTDWLGYDNGFRQLPAGLPNKKLSQATATDEERYRWGQEINSYLSTIRRSTPPNYNGSVVVGDSFKLGQEQKFGFVAALGYGRTYQVQRAIVRNYRLEPLPDGTNVPTIRDDYEGEAGRDSVKWGVLASGALALSRNDELNLTAFRSQSSDNTAWELEGTIDSGARAARNIHIEFVSRTLDFGQLRGRHQFPGVNDAVLDWYASVARAVRDQPDTRDTTYGVNNPALGLPVGYTFLPGSLSSLHFFSDQSEITHSRGLDYTQPLSKNKSLATQLKLGAMMTLRKRDFLARRFVFSPDRLPSAAYNEAAFCAGEVWQPDCPDRLFRPENIGPGALILDETTLQFDQYEASLDVYAGYAMFDASIAERLRLVGGARVEITDQSFVGFDPFNPGPTRLGSRLDSTTLLPAASVVFSATKKSSARFGIARTLARPQLREMAPFLSQSAASELPVQGNPDLTLTKIWNLDLRFEHFPTLREVAAFSVFYKHFTDPIEEVVRPAGNNGIVTYENAEGANLIGLELEARKGLGFLAEVLESFSVLANLTLAHSLIDLGENSGISTNPSRPMAYQSPYVVNVALDYDQSKTDTNIRSLYNVAGPRITSVGLLGLPDTYEEPRHLLDATVSQKLSRHVDLKLAGENLLASPIVYSYRGARVYSRSVDANGVPGPLTPGEENPVVRQGEIGTTISLTATYTY
jgi:hypothetical protein